MRGSFRVESGFRMFLGLIGDLLVAAGRAILSVVTYMIAGMIVGAAGGAAVALYSGASLGFGLLVGAGLGLVVVVAVHAIVAWGSTW